MKYTNFRSIAAAAASSFVLALAACGGGITTDSAVTPVAKPTITAPPVSQTVEAGKTATFMVTATGGGTLAYQWKKNGVDVSGATSSTYTTPATSSADNSAVFTVVVSNSAGTVTSSNATLAVNPVVAPAITSQPAAQSLATGQTASFSVSATGTEPFTYQWKRNGADIPGATLRTYTIPATVIGDNGALFSVVVSNSAGTVTSSKARLSDTSQPLPKSVVAGATATFSVVAAGTGPFTYQWKKNGTNIASATSDSYTTPATTVADSGALYSVAVTNSAGTVTSSTADLTVYATKYSEVANASGGTYDKTECVKDNITGLVWEGKPATGTARLASTTYTNYDSTASGQKDDGSNPTLAEIDASTNSIGYVRSVNTSALCGYTDWYLPTKDELEGLVKGIEFPAIDNAWFLNTAATFYWTSSIVPAYSTGYARYINFVGGGPGYNFRSNSYRVRLVRAGQ